VVPMHYAIPGLKLQLDPLDRFLKEMAVTASEPQPKLSCRPHRRVRDESRGAGAKNRAKV